MTDAATAPDTQEQAQAAEGQLTPRQIVSELDRHIIGQAGAKRAVAIALRNRWRRMQLDERIRGEITPKNILMIGPTGVGKTEIARRLAKLADAPFIKVEATKFTEVGYVGREVDSIVRDLVDVAVKMNRESAMERARPKAELTAEERILDTLLPRPQSGSSEGQSEQAASEASTTRQVFRKRLREGKLDDKEIELDLRQQGPGVEIMAPPGMEEMTNQLQNMFKNMGGDKTKRKKVAIKDAMRLLIDEEAARLVDEEQIKGNAIEQVEQNGIVFIDEIDKVCKRSDMGGGGADVSREGVQVEFAEDGVKRIAEVAFKVNEGTENIGARRLHTVLERLMEEISFDAPDKAGNEITIDAAYVDDKLKDLAEDEDLSRYIL